MSMPVEQRKGERKSLGGEQFERLVQGHAGKMPSMIGPPEDPNSTTQEQLSFFNPGQSFVFAPDEVHVMNKEGVDEYADDEDPGFDLYAVSEENFVASCKELA